MREKNSELSAVNQDDRAYFCNWDKGVKFCLNRNHSQCSTTKTTTNGFILTQISSPCSFLFYRSSKEMKEKSIIGLYPLWLDNGR